MKKKNLRYFTSWKYTFKYSDRPAYFHGFCTGINIELCETLILEVVITIELDEKYTCTNLKWLCLHGYNSKKYIKNENKTLTELLLKRKHQSFETSDQQGLKSSQESRLCLTFLTVLLKWKLKHKIPMFWPCTCTESKKKLLDSNWSR